MSNPYKLRGTKQPISFGVEKLTGYIVDATEETIEGEEIEIEDENNNVVAHFSGFRIRYKRTASGITVYCAHAPAKMSNGRFAKIFVVYREVFPLKM